MQLDPVHRIDLQLAYMRDAGWLPGELRVLAGEVVLDYVPALAASQDVVVLRRS